MRTSSIYFISYLFLISVILFNFSHCKSPKKIQKISNIFISKDTLPKNINNQELINPENKKLDSMRQLDSFLNLVKSRIIKFKTFNAKFKIDYTANQKNETYIANISIIKDSIIYLTFKAQFLGIIGLQALITKDSLILINRINKTIQEFSFNYLKKITQIDLEFKHLQDIIIGNPSINEKQLVNTKIDNYYLTLNFVSENLKMLQNFKIDNFIIANCKLDDNNPLKNRTLNIQLEQLKPYNDFMFSTYREIELTELKNLYIYLTFKDFNFDQPINYKFTLPNYPIIKLNN